MNHDVKCILVYFVVQCETLQGASLEEAVTAF